MLGNGQKYQQRSMSVISAETRILLGLLMLKGVGPSALKRAVLLPGFGDAPIAEVAGQVPQIGRALEASDSWEIAQERAQAQVAAAERHDARILSPLDAEYPRLLAATKDDPFIIYVQGVLSRTPDRSVAVIGTREPTAHGEVIAKRIASFFAESGWSVVSGLAIGCDALAHQAALDVAGHTVAVLAHGLQMIAPSKHKRLAQDILAQGGALVSEYPFGQAVLPNQYVKRDRTQAGMAQGVVMIQSDIKGGSLYASRASLEYGRWLAVPNPTPRDRERQEPKVQANLVILEGPEYARADLLRCPIGALAQVVELRGREDYEKLSGASEQVRSSAPPSQSFDGLFEMNQAAVSDVADDAHQIVDVRVAESDAEVRLEQSKPDESAFGQEPAVHQAELAPPEEMLTAFESSTDPSPMDDGDAGSRVAEGGGDTSVEVEPDLPNPQENAHASTREREEAFAPAHGEDGALAHSQESHRSYGSTAFHESEAERTSRALDRAPLRVMIRVSSLILGNGNKKPKVLAPLKSTSKAHKMLSNVVGSESMLVEFYARIKHLQSQLAEIQRKLSGKKPLDSADGRVVIRILVESMLMQMGFSMRLLANIEKFSRGHEAAGVKTDDWVEQAEARPGESFSVGSMEPGAREGLEAVLFSLREAGLGAILVDPADGLGKAQPAEPAESLPREFDLLDVLAGFNSVSKKALRLEQ
jgi:DNA protecting protein DprA